MSSFRDALIASAALLLASAGAAFAADGATSFHGIGSAPTEAEIAAWDIDIRPDGMGLPPGQGSVADGEEIFTTQCAHCHGDFGYGAGRYPALVGGTVEDLDVQSVRSGPEKTIGSYWPYASTLYDYINRAMPFGNAESLEPDQVYALTAYILNMNGIIDSDAVLDAKSLAAIKMPNEGGFYMDDRPDVHAEACMSDCRDEPKVVSNAKKLAVTPQEEAASQ